MIRCVVCEGRKTILGMGSMKEDCKSCAGKGFMPETSVAQSVEILDKVFKQKLKANQNMENKDIGKLDAKEKEQDKIKKGAHVEG